ncbi:MAG: beta-galactosidase [Mucilaginibacter sp.]|nr:beta-galactosidase [Mucilaginibacter sp.]
MRGQNNHKKNEKLNSRIAQHPTPVGDIESVFDPAFAVKTVSILSQKEAQHTTIPLALVRNANNKLAVMAKDKTGKLQPFYMKGIETGFWDTRKADFDLVFDAYQKMGANAAMFIIHWSDIEPQDGKFDFSYTDNIVAKAKSHGVKIVWALFMHEQFDMLFLPSAEDLWMYNLDTRDGANYAIQWVKDKNGDIIKDIPTQKQKKYSEIMPCYANPIVYNRITRMLGRLAAHYKNSESVIGVQIGNEEHISYQGDDADFNPYTLASFERWKKLTGETSWNRFKLAIVKLWWSRFTTAYHLQDPYKLTMLNPIAGGPEKGETGIIDRSGTDATTFRDSKIDVIATMFYWPSATKIWNNLDQVYKSNNTYSYPTQLPILMSTEIGIGKLNTLPYTQEFMINFLERGSQGFAVYSYGHMGTREGVINENGKFYEKFMAMVTANEDIIWPGLPGTGDNISITATYGGGKISCLHKGNNATLGILHFPDALDDKIKESKADIPVEIMVKKTGKYVIDIYKDGKLTATQADNLTAFKGRSIIIDLSNKAAAFIKVKGLGRK